MKYLQKYSKYFWDVDIDDVDVVKHRDWVVARILEEGSTEAVKEIFKLYSENDIVETICSSIAISPKTARFWQLRLDIKNPIKCIEKQLMKKH